MNIALKNVALAAMIFLWPYIVAFCTLNTASLYSLLLIRERNESLKPVAEGGAENNEQAVIVGKSFVWCSLRQDTYHKPI